VNKREHRTAFRSVFYRVPRLANLGRRVPFAWLVYDSVVYGAVRYLNVASGILLTPIYTRLLTKNDYGVIDVFVTWNAFAAMVITLGLPTALLRFYADVKDDPTRRRETIGTIQGLMLVAALGYGLVILPFGDMFLSAFNTPTAPPEVFYESIVLVVLTSFFTLVQSLHQAALRKYSFAAISVLNFAIATVLGAILVYAFEQGVLGFFRASVVALAVSCVASLFTTREVFAITLKPRACRRLLSYSLPFVGVFFLFQSSNVVDRLVITRFLSLEAAGTFAVANKVAGVLSLAISSFSLAWFPYAMQIKDTASARQVYARMFSYYSAGATVLVTAIAMFRTEIINLFAPGYSEAYNTIAVLCLYNIVAGSVYVLTLGLHITEHTRYIVGPGILSVVVNALTSIALVRTIGLEGIAYGSLLGSIVWVVPQVRKAQALYPIPFTYSFCLKAAILTLAVIYTGPYVDGELQASQTALVIGVKVLLLAAILAALYMTYSTERQRLLISEAATLGRSARKSLDACDESGAPAGGNWRDKPEEARLP
jgi:O-antigen/teichoic acid export membrane protein